MFGSTIRIGTINSRQPWRPLRAGNLSSLMYPNFVFSLTLGLFPYKSNPTGYVFTKMRFVWSMITQLVYVVLLASALYDINVNLNNSTVEVIDLNAFMISEGLMILVMHGLAYQRFHLLEKLGKLTRMLSEQDFENMAKFVHTKDIFGIIFLMLHLPNCIVGLNQATLSCLTILYVLLVYLALDMTYVNCVYVLRACFVKINENLKQLNEHKKPLLASVSSQRGRSFLLLVKLKHYEELHQETSDAVQYLNKAFLFRIIVATIVTFTVVTFNLYFAILFHSTGVKQYKFKRVFFFPHIEAMTFYLGKFAMMIMMCESAKKKAQEICTTVHEILSKCTDEKVRREGNVAPRRFAGSNICKRENQNCLYRSQGTETA
ncbi:uncharacterized protein LOC117222554 isoform X2 [Megalopta genalis]|uniref:uncharacterized protein LOC117222554 isoform X2 n=1 Tax=Megalopta genalis TaxID=115081 RepID=UPI003FD62F2B